MIDHLQKYYMGKAQSSRAHPTSVLDPPKDFNLLKTSRRIDQNNAKMQSLPTYEGES